MGKGNLPLGSEACVVVPGSCVGTGVVVSPIDRNDCISSSGTDDRTFELGTGHNQIGGSFNRKERSGNGDIETKGCLGGGSSPGGTGGQGGDVSSSGKRSAGNYPGSQTTE